METWEARGERRKEQDRYLRKRRRGDEVDRKSERVKRVGEWGRINRLNIQI